MVRVRMTKPTADQSSELAALWLPDDPDDSGAFEAQRSLAAAVAQVEGIRPFAPSTRELQAAIGRESCHIDELRAIVERAPTIAIRVMQRANGDQQKPCAELGAATTLLGTEGLGALAREMSASERCHHEDSPAAEIIRHSAHCGQMARRLARQFFPPAAETAFTCALLHDIGKLLMLQVADDLADNHGPAPYPTLLERSKDGAVQLHSLEQELYGYDHDVLAAHTLRAWSIPSPIPEVIAGHHQPNLTKESDETVRKLVALVRLANQLSYEASTSGTSAVLDDADMHILGIEGPTLDAFRRQAQATIQ